MARAWMVAAALLAALSASGWASEGKPIRREGYLVLPASEGSGDAPLLVIGSSGSLDRDIPRLEPAALRAARDRAEATGDWAEAAWLWLDGYFQEPSQEAAEGFVRAARAWAKANPARNRMVSEFVRELIENEPRVHAPFGELLTDSRRWSPGRDEGLMIAEVGADGVEGDFVTAGELELRSWLGVDPDAGKLFPRGRAYRTEDVFRAGLKESAEAVRKALTTGGAEEAFRLGVAAVRALRWRRAQRRTNGFLDVMWPLDTGVTTIDDTLGMSEIPFSNPRQGSAILKLWFTGNRRRTLAELEAQAPGALRRVVAVSTVPGQQEEFTLHDLVQTAAVDDPQVIEELLQVVQFGSPIVIDLAGAAGYRDGSPTLTGAQDQAAAVPFDLNGTGEPVLAQWLRPGEDAWLAEDVDGDGRITSGLELFGTAGGFANGFEKLARRDLDGDGFVAGPELDGLVLWRELRADGRSDPDELTPVAAAGLTAIRIPRFGLRSTVVIDGSARPCWDVFPSYWREAPAAD